MIETIYAPLSLSLFVQGLEEKFDAMDRRQNATEKQTSTRFKEVQKRIDQFESRLNDSKTETEARMKELEARINDQCQRPTGIPDSLTSSRPTSRPVSSTVTTPSGEFYRFTERIRSLKMTDE